MGPSIHIHTHTEAAVRFDIQKYIELLHKSKSMKSTNIRISEPITKTASFLVNGDGKLWAHFSNRICREYRTLNDSGRIGKTNKICQFYVVCTETLNEKRKKKHYDDQTLSSPSNRRLRSKSLQIFTIATGNPDIDQIPNNQSNLSVSDK